MSLANNPDPIITMLILRCGMENDQGYRTRPVPIMNHATKPLIAFHDKEPAILYDISFFGVASRRSLQDTNVVIIGKLWAFYQCYIPLNYFMLYSRGSPAQR